MSFPTDTNCQFQGNQDLYGLGVRLSFYIQTLSFILKTRSGRRGEKDHLCITAIGFMTALWIVLVRDTGYKIIRGTEAAVMLYLILCQAACVFLVMDMYSKKFVINVIASTLWVMVVYGSAFYGAWLYWTGLDALPRTSCVEYFAASDIRGGFRGWNRFFYTVLCIAIAGYLVFVMVVVMVFGPIVCLFEAIWACLKPILACFGKLIYWEAFYAKISGWMRARKYIKQHLTMRRLSVLVLVAILAVFVPVFEVTLRRNNIRDIDRLDSVGQLTPLILAVGQLLTDMYTAGRRWVKQIEDRDAQRLEQNRKREDQAIWKRYCCCFSFFCCFDSGEKENIRSPDEDKEDEKEESEVPVCPNLLVPKEPQERGRQSQGVLV